MDQNNAKHGNTQMPSVVKQWQELFVDAGKRSNA